jgi:hypothetical protein
MLKFMSASLRQQRLAVLMASLVLAFSSVSSVSVNGQDKKTKQQLKSAIFDIQQQRTMAESRVKDLKIKFKGKENSTEYKKAKRLYGDAYASFDSYVKIIVSSVRQGEKLDDLSEIGNKALETNKAFLTYADSALDTPESSQLVWQEIFEIGKGLYKLWKKNKVEKREKAAIEVEKQIKWREWENVS